MNADPTRGAGPRRRAVFLDVDGTIIDHDGIIAASTHEAIQLARSAGHGIYLCTGRARSELWPGLLEIGFDGFIGGAGAYVETGGEVLVHHTFTSDDIQRVHDVLISEQVMVYFEAHDAVYAQPHVHAHLVGILDAIPDRDRAATLRRGMFEFIDRIDTVQDPRSREVTKAVYMGAGRSVDEIRAAFGPRFDVLPSSTLLFGDDCGEVALPGVHKASGIEALVDHLGIDWADTIAIGDGHNDLEMLQRVAVGIAMGNAPRIVQDHADEVTASVSDDGVLRAFERHGLLG